MNGVAFDATIRLGDILAIAGMLLGGFGAYVRLSTGLEAVQGEVKKLADVVILQARQDQQLKDIDRRLSALEK